MPQKLVPEQTRIQLKIVKTCEKVKHQPVKKINICVKNSEQPQLKLALSRISC